MSTIFIPNPPHLQPSQVWASLRNKHQRGALMLLSLILLTVCLCGWQLWRAYEKNQLLHEIERLQAMPELSWQQGVPPEWRLLQLQGQWLNQYEIWLDHRLQEGKVGYQVVTPFQLKDGTILLVNRGWWAGNESAPPAAKNLPRVVAQAWPRYLELGAAPINGRVFQNLDPGRFAAWAYLPLPAAYVTARDGEPGLTALTSERPFGVERHLGYALTWALLAIFGSYLFRRFYLHKV
ncbi:SURF1 family protein [Chitinibacter bivalviorum]|uniref:SURF1-like protein n=1 Tax=Chitinibacter bivalviorum TaxID=2739434 RepID=A0A7H9BKS7_9NEIS|nr:SURF1 family protein [Chitinibacter bivalviorum]QLG89270.1 SURF1 family protein [Chitinibacter bivalviorum]